MPNPFLNLVKSTKTSIFGSSSTPNSPTTTENDSATQPTTTTTAMATPTAPTTTTANVEIESRFREVYQCAKLNSEWFIVSKAIKEYPNWLTRIPDGRRWTMLHQIVFSGNVHHLKEVLSYQLGNPDFRLLHKASDGKTIREVACERASVFPQMIRYIEVLIFQDQLLNNAKEGKWEIVIQSARQKPDCVNDKPPYRRYYLGHHLAIVGALDIFKKIHEIAPFKLNLVCDNKTIGQIARDHNKIEFAEYIASLPVETEEASSTATSSGGSGYVRPGHHYSPGFYDDISISIFPPNIDFTTHTVSGVIGQSLTGHYHHPISSHSSGYTASSSSHPMSSSASSGSASGHHGDSKPKATASATTYEEDVAYEKTIMGNVDKIKTSEITSLITCPITKQIMRDPVIAADGFTYEREAILKNFQESNRSPMTNQPLENFDLKPNLGIKSLLKSLEISANPTKTKSSDK